MVSVFPTELEFRMFNFIDWSKNLNIIYDDPGQQINRHGKFQESVAKAFYEWKAKDF